MSELGEALAECIDRARATGDYGPLLGTLPYTRFLGLGASVRGDSILLHLPYRASLLGNPVLPAIHGGVVGACLESAALLQIIHVRKALPLPRSRAALAIGEAMEGSEGEAGLGTRLTQARTQALALLSSPSTLL